MWKRKEQNDQNAIDEESDNIIFGESSEYGRSVASEREDDESTCTWVDTNMVISPYEIEIESIHNVRQNTMNFTQYYKKQIQGVTRHLGRVKWESCDLEESPNEKWDAWGQIHRRQRSCVHLEDLKRWGIRQLVQQQCKEQKPCMTAMKHKRSLIVKKLLEEEERDLRMSDDTSMSLVMSALMMTLKEKVQ